MAVQIIECLTKFESYADNYNAELALFSLINLDQFKWKFNLIIILPYTI